MNKSDQATTAIKLCDTDLDGDSGMTVSGPHPDSGKLDLDGDSGGTRATLTP